MKIHAFLIAFVILLSQQFSYGQCDDTEVAITTTTGQYGYEMGWSITDDQNNEWGFFDGGDDYSEYADLLCLPNGCYVLQATDSYGDGWNGGSIEISFDGVLIPFSLDDGGFGDLAFGINATGCLTAIEQTLADHSITLLVDSGAKNNRINWAFQNRDMPNPNNEFANEAEFLSMLDEGVVAAFTVGDPLEKEPFARYREFFNLYAWYWDEPGLSEDDFDWALLKALRDAYFLPWADNEHGWATLFSISRYGGGGGAGTQPDTRTGDGKMYGVEWETLLHEFCHTMPQIPDEYSASGEWSGGNCWESPNTTGQTVREMIPWRNWIEPGTPLPTPYVEENIDVIGAYEGALTNFFGCHRPTARNCIMGAGGFGEGYGQGLCAPCRQRVVCFLYKYVNVIEDPQPASSSVDVIGGQTVTFSADIVKPEPNTQVYTWLLNGEVIDEGTEYVDVTFGNCDSYTLTLTVEDTTSWVRYDSGFDEIYPKPFESHTWLIDQTDIDDYNLAVDISVQNAGCTGEANGVVDFEVSGGGAGTYSAFWQGTSVGLSHADLSPGIYDYWVKDIAGCGVEVEAEVMQDPLLGVQLCSTFENGWSVSLEIDGYDPQILDYLWSTGQETSSISDIQDGSYEVSVTTADGCTVSESFELIEPENLLEAEHELFPSAEDTPTGSIYLTITGGNPDYSVKWYQKEWADLTADIPNQIYASGSDFGHLPQQAFDNDLDTKWLQSGTGNVWVSFDFLEAHVIEQYAITSADDVEDRDPKDWVFEGSDDGNTWVTLDTRTDEDFATRKLRRVFIIDNTTAYEYYRLYVTDNSGANEVQLQELEFIGADPAQAYVYLPEHDDQLSLLEIASGEYVYSVTDENQSCENDTVEVVTYEPFELAGIDVVQENECSVTIASPDPNFTYLWLSDESGTEILFAGLPFSPPAPGNYWVAAMSNETGGISDNRPGFAVTMPDQPEVFDAGDGVLEVADPNPQVIYNWYTEECGGVPIATGTDYTPDAESQLYWVAAWWAEPFPEPINPTDIPGMVKRIDAADLNGDGVVDDPGPVTSSLYDWDFTPDGSWNDGSWFAFRGNYQNGLGIADFATMWLQCFQPAFQGYQSIVMAYKENALSWEGSAPFFGLDNSMPFSANPSEQLYSDAVPASTLNENTWLNGALVDPMDTPNPLDFCVLGQNFGNGVGWTDCTDTHWEGQLGEALFYQDPLTDAQMIGVSEFLRKKWISTADLESRRTPILWEGTVGLADQQLESSMTIVPNPGSENAVLQIQIPVNQRINIRLVSSNGRMISETFIQGDNVHFSLAPWAHNLEPGMYLIEVNSEHQQRQVLRWLKM